jgi:hypothetical protein
MTLLLSAARDRCLEGDLDRCRLGEPDLEREREEEELRFAGCVART